MLRVGLIEYINMLPLVGQILEDPPEDVDIITDTPSALSKMLKERTLDLSFISSSEYIENKDQYQLVKEFGIAANGPVKSVHLYTKLPLNYIDTIYVTNQSKTSFNLCRVLCALHWDIAPKFEVLDDFNDLVSKDAFLLIGNVALMQPYFEGYHTIDLAQQWNEMTRSPFVFGVLAYNNGCDQTEVNRFIDRLKVSFEWGQKNRASIIDMARKTVPIQEHLIDDYYKHVYNLLTQKELDAIDLFAELLEKTDQAIPV